MKNNNYFFNPAFEHNCLKSCWFNYLIQQNYHNPLIYIDASIKISDYMCQSHEQVSNIGLYKRYQNKVYVNYGDINKVWQADIKILTQGVPLIFDVDVYYLPYRPEYKKIHGSHGVICKSYIGEKLELVDWSKQCFFNDFVSIHDVLKSRNSLNPYDDNPYSGYPLNSYSIALIDTLEDRKVDQCLVDWINSIYIDFDYFDKLVLQLESGVEVKKICDSWYLILSDMQFAYFFLDNIICNNKNRLLNLLNTLISNVKLFNYTLLKYYLAPKTCYIIKGLNKMQDIRRLLNEFVEELSYLGGMLDA